VKGEVVYFRLFDIGASVDVAEIRRRADSEFISARAPSEHAAPRYARFPEPLLVTVDRRTLETSRGLLTLDMSARLYAVGAIAVTLRAAFDVPSIRDLIPFAGLRILRDGTPETLDEYCGRIATRIEEDLVPYMRDSYDVRVDPEAYLAYCVKEPDVPTRLYVDARRAEVTALLAADPRPDDISDEEVADTWKNWFSYYKDDLVVIEWDAALVIEPTGKYEDTLAAFEIANLQLLELRTYDAYLDKVIDKAYDDLDSFFSRGGVLRSGREMVKELADVRMDLGEVTDEVENISKFFGDWFLGKVYIGCARKFELESWRRIVNDKMQALSEIYHVAQAEVESRRMFLLEVLIVLLFAVDLVLIFYLG